MLRLGYESRSLRSLLILPHLPLPSPRTAVMRLCCVSGVCHVSFFVLGWFRSFPCRCSVPSCCWFRFVWWLLFLVGSFFSAVFFWQHFVGVLCVSFCCCCLCSGCLSFGWVCRVCASCLLFLSWFLLGGLCPLCSVVALFRGRCAPFFFKKLFKISRRFRDRSRLLAIANPNHNSRVLNLIFELAI